MDPIMICFIMSTVLATPDAQNVTLQCPQVAQEEVINLFEEFSTPTNDDNDDNNDNSRDNNNDSDDNDKDDLPSCDDDNRPRPGSCRDEHDYDECEVTPERCEEDNDQ
jgi:hypothetical protein